jgi:hypothetical protein
MSSRFSIYPFGTQSFTQSSLWFFFIKLFLVSHALANHDLYITAIAGPVIKREQGYGLL